MNSTIESIFNNFFLNKVVVGFVNSTLCLLKAETCAKKKKKKKRKKEGGKCKTPDPAK